MLTQKGEECPLLEWTAHLLLIIDPDTISFAAIWFQMTSVELHILKAALNSK